MNKKLSISVLVMAISLFSISVSAQLRSRTTEKTAPPPISRQIRSTAAYAEIIVRRTEVLSEIEELLVTYKEEFPKVKNARYELSLLDSVLARFSKLKPADAPRLTEAVGKLIIRRTELAKDYWIQSARYSVEHPNARKAKRKLEIYDDAVEELLR